MRQLLIICLMILLQACQSTQIVEKQKEETQKQIVNTELKLLVCESWFETLDGKKINRNNLFYNKFEFFEVYQCKSNKSKDVALTRLEADFYTEEIIINNDGHIYEPQFSLINGTGFIYIQFQMKKNTTATVRIKNTYGQSKYSKH